MIVIEAKLKGTQSQYSKLDEAISTGQFIRNTCLRHWEDNKGVTRNDLQKLYSVLAKNKEIPWTKKLNLAKSISDASWYQFTLAKGFKLLAEYLNSTVGHRSSRAKSSKAQGETDLWLKNGDALGLSWLDELRTKNSWESPTIFGVPNIVGGGCQSPP